MNNGEHQPRRRRVLPRWGLIVWLMLPILIVVALWFSIDRSQGQPDKRQESINRSLLPGQDPKTGKGMEPGTSQASDSDQAEPMGRNQP